MIIIFDQFPTGRKKGNRVKKCRDPSAERGGWGMSGDPL